ncbi:10424_t:CDS:10 [Ambispora leptoticha]|uniref:10424_t:CDS:1 n=1 Tax=Ambispora leptoticha TaxID=144679 RepID=A0A9N8ZIP2_9GLOM|nr:10424_t:CDS:10 [Ambispora leptoticha]
MANEIKSFGIFPALNVARLGNAEEYYIGSEIPGVYVGEGDPEFKFKDKNGRVKPQAARFRIYGYNEEKKIIREIKLTDAEMKVEIQWTVVLANKKAAHQQFLGIKNRDPNGPMRNANWPYDRSTLEAICMKSLSASSDNNFEEKCAEFKARVYRHSNNNDDSSNGHELYLGKMILEKEGSLLIIGGKGESGCVKKGALITQYANNDYWYDDTSDGSIDAIVKINGKPLEHIEGKGKGKSWVLVSPPKFAPGISNLVSLYQTIWETQHPDYPFKHRKVEYYRDIYPIFEAIYKHSWVNKMAFIGHGVDKPGHFLKPELEDLLKYNDEKDPIKYQKAKDLRTNILSRIRIPPEIASTFEYDGQAYPYFMPPLSGNAGDATPTNPDTYLTVTRGQYILLQKWAEGDFEVDDEPPKYSYVFKNDAGPIDGFINVTNDDRYPKYKKDADPREYSFEEIVTDLSEQVKYLNKAALEWCVGGPFFPGIEMTYVAYNKDTFDEKYEFRINSNTSPGDINAYLALPWQADFNECNTHWWPAQRPDIVIPEIGPLFTKKAVRDMEIPEKDPKISLDDFAEWTRGFRTNEPVRGLPKWGDLDMIRAWDRLGFVVEKQVGNLKAFVEVQRGNIYKLNDLKPGDKTLDSLYELLKIALQIEFSTIPPYLYSMYSIKPGTSISDEVRNHIRNVVAEEMLHLSLVANLIVAIGRQPIFYSPEVIPFYPNPFPHFQQGEIILHLSKADKSALETFVKIEAPEKRPLTQETKLTDEINIISVGDLYMKIESLFIELDKEINYNTHFQLCPGMGYAPTAHTPEEGLIVVKNLNDVKRAIDLIIIQGEGSPEKSENSSGESNKDEKQKSHYQIFKECLKLIDEQKSDYHLWPVMEDPLSTSYTDPNILAAVTAFNAAYSYLLLLLQTVWRTDGQKKKNLIMGGMPALMHGVLKPIATFLAETPISADTHAGATFEYYEFTHEPSPKQQLLTAIQAASKVFPYNDALKDSVKAVSSLPDIFLPIFNQT